MKTRVAGDGRGPDRALLLSAGQRRGLTARSLSDLTDFLIIARGVGEQRSSGWATAVRLLGPLSAAAIAGGVRWSMARARR